MEKEPQHRSEEDRMRDMANEGVRMESVAGNYNFNDVADKWSTIDPGKRGELLNEAEKRHYLWYTPKKASEKEKNVHTEFQMKMAKIYNEYNKELESGSYNNEQREKLKEIAERAISKYRQERDESIADVKRTGRKF